LAPYEQALRTAGPLGLRTEDGRFIELQVKRWLGPTDAADETVVERCRGPVLDIGCGPGRFVASFSERGIPALGVDIADTAVGLTRRLGLPTLLRSVFHDLPGEGRWPTVLLLDGNIGIGGDPTRLLERVATLLRPGGRLVVETDPDPDRYEIIEVRFTEGGQVVGPPFDWARVGLDPLTDRVRGIGYRIHESWSAGGRTFAAVGR
jgi:SAM-dependent methyltransferase